MFNSVQDFVQSIESDNLPEDIARHFDKVMALRHLIGGRTDTDIRVDKIEGKFGFSVVVEKEEEATRLSDMINGKIIECYGKTLYAKSAKENDCCFSVLLTKNKHK